MFLTIRRRNQRELPQLGSFLWLFPFTWIYYIIQFALTRNYRIDQHITHRHQHIVSHSSLSTAYLGHWQVPWCNREMPWRKWWKGLPTSNSPVLKRQMQGHFFTAWHLKSNGSDWWHTCCKAACKNEYVYVCRKEKHSINVKVVCTNSQEFTDTVVKHPGITHDSFIWSNCNLCRRCFAGGDTDGWLLGDSR